MSYYDPFDPEVLRSPLDDKIAELKELMRAEIEEETIHQLEYDKKLIEIRDIEIKNLKKAIESFKAKETAGEADNIDRFDAYRIYETLEYLKFSEMTLEEKLEKVTSTIDRLTKYKEMKLGTATAKSLWLQRLEYYIGFYEKLKVQLENSFAIL